MNQIIGFQEIGMEFSMEHERRPRILYTIKEPGKQNMTIASPCLEMGNPNQIAWALRQLAEMIEQPYIDPYSHD